MSCMQRLVFNDRHIHRDAIALDFVLSIVLPCPNEQNTGYDNHKD